ncbi:MAG: DUF222 domain-containing protein [Actinobacteria bacterium]|nr:DUF222 domain-containing protein [Actinomycetota bacterium]
MFEELDGAIATIERFVAEFEPGLLDARGSVRAVERFARAKNTCEAGLALAGIRADETGAYRESGARNAAEWVARKAGTSVVGAERALDTAVLLSELPATDAAMRAGKISQEQAYEIAAAARKDPGAECALVQEAKQGISLKGLKDRCRRVRAAAEADDEAWAKRLHDNRQLRRWIDADTAACGMYRLSPEKGAEVSAAIDAEIELILKEARAAGTFESREAYAADALHALITRGPRKATGINLIIDGKVASSGESGTIEIGSRCEIVGVGPIPVTLAKQLLADAKVRVVPADESVLPKHESATRYLPQWMRDWLDQQYPVCGQPDCDRDFRLEYDHIVGLADGGTTTLDNLWRLCWYHHRQKTIGALLVTGEARDWRLVPRDRRLSRAGPDPP